jgi:UDP-N-acetylmuramate--alanine ligase
VVIGGKLKGIGSNAVLGKGDFIVAEADESDGSFLKFSPAIAVVTNIDREHLDYYQDLETIKAVFLDFIDRIPFYGLAILCLDNESIQDLIPKIKKRYTTYGMSSQADFQIRDVVYEKRRSSFSVYRKGHKLGRFTLNLPGIHNVYNATAGIATGVELEVPMDAIESALQTLEGVQRRLEIKGEVNGITVVDDYGHHPTEIKTTLQAIEECWPDNRKIIVFQPHRYTRTQALFDDFTRSFYQSDVLLVLPIYAAGEQNIEGITGRKLCEGIKAHGHKEVLYSEGQEDAIDYLRKNLKSGDVLLTLGAGDVWQVGTEILKALH